MRARLGSIIIGFADAMGNNLNSHREKWAHDRSLDDNHSLKEIHKEIDIGGKNEQFYYERNGDKEKLTLTSELLEVVASQSVNGEEYSDHKIKIVGYVMFDGQKKVAITLAFGDRDDGYPDEIVVTEFVLFAEQAMDMIRLCDRKWNGGNYGGIGSYCLSHRFNKSSLWAAYRQAEIKDKTVQVLDIIHELVHCGVTESRDEMQISTNLTLENALPELVAVANRLKLALNRENNPAFRLACQYFDDGWRAYRVPLGPDGLVEFQKGETRKQYRIGSEHGCAIQLDMGFTDETIKMRDQFSRLMLDLTAEEEIQKVLRTNLDNNPLATHRPENEVATKDLDAIPAARGVGEVGPGTEVGPSA